MKSFENDFVSITYEEERSFISFIYKPSDKEIEDEDFRHNMTVYGDIALEHKPIRLLVDTQKGTYTVPPETQEWVAKVIAPKTISLKKMAFLVHPDIFAQVATEQMMEEEGIIDKYEAPRYFQSLEEAEDWLFEDL